MFVTICFSKIASYAPRDNNNFFIFINYVFKIEFVPNNIMHK